MSLMYRLLLLTVFALLTAFSKAEEVDHTTISRSTASGDGGRLLRAAIMSDDEKMSLPVTSFIKSRVTNLRINSWIKNRYSDDDVLGMLRLTGLTGKPLTEHSNFKIFQKFKIDGWLKESATTTKAWDHLGLTGLTAAQVETADGLGTYVGYVIALNEKTKKKEC
ncbi:hypothetical protein PI124_g5819 [Phytophthora idaei]|nr:hypothetical protein PI125_g10678 [Phytophthora idaei]KAG3148677.1 hypothetical protein PI126_g12348 [Phytophthora idaei]KAG3249502.1 hypothetical protein PI124_g5819 [Phytophthora idaei]